jgi:hypothetical protein
METTAVTESISDADIARFREEMEREVAEITAEVLTPDRIKEILARVERERAEQQRLGWPAYVELQRQKYPLKPKPKKARKTRAAPATKATINRHIDIALARGLPVKGISPDGTVLTAVNSPEPITARPLATDDLDRELADFEARHG